MATKEQEAKWAKEHEARKELLDVGEPLIAEAIKGLKGLSMGERMYTYPGIPVKMPRMKDSSLGSGVVRIDFKHDKIKAIVVIHHHEEGYHDVVIPLGDPDLVVKMRKAIVKWRAWAKAKWIRWERRDIKDCRRNISHEEKKIAQINAKIDKFKELFK